MRTHIARVRSRAVDRLRGELSTATENFGHESILKEDPLGSIFGQGESEPDLEVCERDTFWIVMLAEEKVPQSELPGLSLQLVKDRNDGLPTRRIAGQLRVCYGERGHDFFLQQRDE